MIVEHLGWIESTEAAVRNLCTATGWNMERTRWSGVSRYYDIYRAGVDSDGDDASESFCLRISDHGTCYASEDYSLVPSQGGDDHTLERVEARLLATFKADNGY